MKCPSCGADVPSNAAYCPQCGKTVTHDKAGEKPASPAAAPDASQSRSSQDFLAPGASNETDEAFAASEKETLWEGRYSLRAMIDRVAISAVITVVAVLAGALGPWGEWTALVWTIIAGLLVVLWLYQIGVYVYRHYGHYYRLTPHTFFDESGILVRSTSPIEIVGISDMSFEQSLLERPFGVGTIRLLSDDTTSPKLVLRGIANVQDAFQRIDQARRVERRRRAVRMDHV